MNSEDRAKSMTYVARCPECNHICMATVDRPEYAKSVAKEVATCIRDGYLIERMTVREVRECDFGHADDCSKILRRKRA
jgi:hypothetical protein